MEALTLKTKHPALIYFILISAALHYFFFDWLPQSEKEPPPRKLQLALVAPAVQKQQGDLQPVQETSDTAESPNETSSVPEKKETPPKPQPKVEQHKPAPKPVVTKQQPTSKPLRPSQQEVNIKEVPPKPPKPVPPKPVPPKPPEAEAAVARDEPPVEPTPAAEPPAPKPRQEPEPVAAEVPAPPKVPTPAEPVEVQRVPEQVDEEPVVEHESASQINHSAEASQNLAPQDQAISAASDSHPAESFKSSENSTARKPSPALVNSNELDPGFKRLTNARLEYPQLARRLRKSGEVELELLISESGEVVELTILAETGSWGFGQAVTKAYRNAQFSPPTVNGQPVRVKWQQKIVFKP